MSQTQEKKIQYTKFENVPVSTKTYIVVTNIEIDMERLYHYLPVYQESSVCKTRRKNIPEGSIISVRFGNRLRTRETKSKTKNSDYFRNSITIVIWVNGKKINTKITRNGKFQMTGCKNDEQPQKCVLYIWNLIRENSNLFTKTNNQPFTAIFIPAMRNISIHLGFKINRDLLSCYFNPDVDRKYIEQIDRDSPLRRAIEKIDNIDPKSDLYKLRQEVLRNECCSLFDTEIGYTGVNTKFPVKQPIEQLSLMKLIFKNDNWGQPKSIIYREYLNTLNSREQKKRTSKDRYNTFLIFHSGQVIMSSMCDEFARESYSLFMDIVTENREFFEEKLRE